MLWWYYYKYKCSSKIKWTMDLFYLFFVTYSALIHWPITVLIYLECRPMSIVKKHFTKIQVLWLNPLLSPTFHYMYKKMGGLKECICASFRTLFWVLNLYNNRLFRIFHLSTLQYRRCIFPLTIEEFAWAIWKFYII